jgi:hypothetical protein
MLKYFYAWAVMHQFILRIFRNRFPDPSSTAAAPPTANIPIRLFAAFSASRIFLADDPLRQVLVVLSNGFSYLQQLCWNSFKRTNVKHERQSRLGALRHQPPDWSNGEVVAKEVWTQHWRGWRTLIRDFEPSTFRLRVEKPSSSRCRPGPFWLLVSAGSSIWCVPDLWRYGRGNDRENDHAGHGGAALQGSGRASPVGLAVPVVGRAQVSKKASRLAVKFG